MNYLTQINPLKVARYIGVSMYILGTIAVLISIATSITLYLSFAQSKVGVAIYLGISILVSGGSLLALPSAVNLLKTLMIDFALPRLLLIIILVPSILFVEYKFLFPISLIGHSGFMSEQQKSYIENSDSYQLNKANIKRNENAYSIGLKAVNSQLDNLNNELKDCNGLKGKNNKRWCKHGINKKINQANKRLTKHLNKATISEIASDTVENGIFAGHSVFELQSNAYGMEGLGGLIAGEFFKETAEKSQANYITITALVIELMVLACYTIGGALLYISGGVVKREDEKMDNEAPSPATYNDSNSNDDSWEDRLNNITGKMQNAFTSSPPTSDTTRAANISGVTNFSNANFQPATQENYTGVGTSTDSGTGTSTLTDNVITEPVRHNPIGFIVDKQNVPDSTERTETSTPVRTETSTEQGKESTSTNRVSLDRPPRVRRRSTANRPAQVRTAGTADTGVEGKNCQRYTLLKEAIIKGTFFDSSRKTIAISSIRSFSRCSSDVARVYMAALKNHRIIDENKNVIDNGDSHA